MPVVDLARKALRPAEVRLALWSLQALGKLGAASPRPASFLDFTIDYLDFDSLVFVLREVFLARDYEFDCPTQKPFIVDCGSNIGTALLFFKQIYPESRILGFEPDPQTFAVLERNAKANALTGVELRNRALAGQAGPIDFFRDAHRNGALYMSTDPRIVRAVSRDGGSESTVVEGVRLSSCVDEPIDFLKLDAEGAEHAILLDLAQNNKLSLVHQMVMEFHHFPEDSQLPETLLLLKENGFAYRVHANMRESGDRKTLQTLLIRAWRP